MIPWYLSTAASVPKCPHQYVITGNACDNFTMDAFWSRRKISQFDCNPLRSSGSLSVGQLLPGRRTIHPRRKHPLTGDVPARSRHPAIVRYHDKSSPSPAPSIIYTARAVGVVAVLVGRSLIYRTPPPATSPPRPPGQWYRGPVAADTTILLCRLNVGFPTKFRQ